MSLVWRSAGLSSTIQRLQYALVTNTLAFILSSGISKNNSDNYRGSTSSTAKGWFSCRLNFLFSVSIESSFFISGGFHSTRSFWSSASWMRAAGLVPVILKASVPFSFSFSSELRNLLNERWKAFKIPGTSPVALLQLALLLFYFLHTVSITLWTVQKSNMPR